MSVLKILKFLFTTLAFSLLLTSCDKSENDLLTSPSNTSNANLISNFTSNDSNSNSSQDSIDCFEIVYPVTLIFPDNSETLVNNDDELEDALEAWYQANENSDEYPTFKFPIQVTLSAGTVQDVADEEELGELIDNCYDYEDCEYFDDYEGEIEDLCFSFNYPIAINFPDGTSQSVDNDTTLENLIEQWYMANGDEAGDPSLAYPVDITLEDGTIQTLNSDDDLDTVLDMCFEDYYGDYDYDDYDGEEFDFEDECFTLVYPISVQLPDGSILSANNDDELDEIFDNYFDNVSDTTESYPMLVYPISIELSDSTTQVINNEEELEQAFESCYDEEYGEELDLDDLCFDVNYPVTIILPDGTNTEANNDDEAEDIIEKWYEDNPSTDQDPTLAFPITITKEDGSQETINSEEELEAAIMTCYNG